MLTDYRDVHREIIEFQDVKQCSCGIIFTKVMVRTEDFACSASNTSLGLSEKQDVICVGFFDRCSLLPLLLTGLWLAIYMLGDY